LKGGLNMTTKFSKEEMLPAKDLRTISQKELLDRINKLEKIGVIIKDELAIAMIKYETFETMIARIRELEDKLEDMQLGKMFGGRVGEESWEEKPEEMTLTEWYEEGKNLKKDSGH
jgi:ATP-dependent RNA circularization protein (DNA/RNA ligase family)